MNNAFWGGIFIALISAYLLKHAIDSLRQFEPSMHWPRVKGKMIESQAVRYSATSNRWNFIVKYEYLVNGKLYNGYRVALYTIANKDEVNQIEKEYQPGAEVMVYYQPNNPSKAILITGGRENKQYGEVLLACIGFATGISVAIAGHYGLLGS